MESPGGPPFYITLQNIERLKVESEQHARELAQLWEALDPLHSAVERHEVLLTDLRCQRTATRELLWRWVVGVCVGLTFLVGGIIVKMYLLDMPKPPHMTVPNPGGGK